MQISTTSASTPNRRTGAEGAFREEVITKIEATPPLGWLYLLWRYQRIGGAIGLIMGLVAGWQVAIWHYDDLLRFKQAEADYYKADAKIREDRELAGQNGETNKSGSAERIPKSTLPDTQLSPAARPTNPVPGDVRRSIEEISAAEALDGSHNELEALTRYKTAYIDLPSAFKARLNQREIEQANSDIDPTNAGEVARALAHFRNAFARDAVERLRKGL